jgi:hypothetical protein
MEEIFINVLSLAYGLVGVIGILAYWPTIVDLYHHKKLSANVMSFIMWTFSEGIAFMYSLFVLDDLLFRFVSGMHFLACLIILILSYNLKSTTENE